eukprot:TRINITY_DN11619_c0_g1_i1.p1 TRINITY_DN11619_c0_g1~~TRINITY_DN11619_c0_g1_i1.p1  ORF type:complete len:334 (+),score=86.25 TRINITY_DN11619_c0_g1_i1:84-1085(+)
MPLELRPLGSQGLVAPKQGYGAMGLSSFYASDKDEATKEAEGLKTLDRYVELSGGHALINTAWLYHSNTGGLHNMEILGKAIAKHGRDKFIITAKLGASLQSIDCSEAGIRKHLDDALRWLGTDYLDVFIQNRMDPNVPVEQVAATAKKLVQEGKIRYWGVSEASADEIRRAHAAFPLTLIEQEWSLQTRDLEAQVAPACRELGIGILAYSPLGRGLLTATNVVTAGDWRSHLPRFSGENLEKNAAAAQRLAEIAARRGCTAAQLALAWVHSRGANVFPIPGTRTPDRLEQNVAAASIELTPQEIKEIEAAVPVGEGGRYPEAMAQTLFNARQ